MSRVVSINPFDGLSDEQDAPTQQQKKKTVQAGQITKPKKPSQPAATPAAPTATAPAKESAPAAPASKNAPKAGDQKENQQKGPKVQGGQLQGKPLAQRAGVNNPAPAPAQVSQSIVGEDQPPLVEKDKSHRPPKDHRDGPRPPRQGDGSAQGRRPHQRVFDRKSGTGRPMNENKKDGSGRGNWGNEADTAEALAEVEAQEAAGRDAAEATNAEGPAATSPSADKPDRKKNRKDKTGDVAAEEETPKEPEKPTMSYEEYLLKQKETKKPQVEKLKVRTVEAGDLTGMTLIKRDSEEPQKKKVDTKEQKKKAKTPGQIAKEKEEEQKKKELAAAQNSIAAVFVHPPIRDPNDTPRRGGRGGGRSNGERRSDERKERSTFNRTPGSGRGRGGNPNNHQAVADTPASAPVADKPIFMAEDFPSIAPVRPANSPSLGQVSMSSPSAAPTKA